MAIKQFLFVDDEGFYTEGHVEGSAISRACDSSLAIGDLVMESTSITDGVDKVTGNGGVRSVIGYCIAKPTTTTAEIMTKGVIDGLTGLSKGSKVYLGTNGSFTSSKPTQGYVHILGHAIENNKIDFDPANTKIKLYVGGIDSYTRLLIQSDTYDGDTNIVDSSDYQVSLAHDSTMKHSTAEHKIGTSSIHCGGYQIETPDNSTDFVMGTGDFTVDFWMKHAGTSGYVVAIGNYKVERLFAIYFDSGNSKLKFGAANSDGTSYTSGEFIIDSNWNHIAFSRENGTGYLFLNGILQSSSATWNADFNACAHGLWIGALCYQGTASYGWGGYIDEFRVSKGIARWTANFTPSTQHYTH